MAEVLLFHHVHGRTPGVLAFADALTAAGHTVHAPDLFDGQVFDTIEQGMAFADSLGTDALVERATRTAEALPGGLVYVGFSLGVVPAQKLAQTRPGAQGAVLCYSCIPTEFFGPWPDAVPVQIHGAERDPFFAGEGDIDAARELVATAPDAELFLYPGDTHLFADSSLPGYDSGSAQLLTDRTLALLDRVS